MTAYLDNLFYRQPNQFQFTLIVNFTDRYVLRNAPRNWEGNLINCSRSDKYYGMFRSYTSAVDFVLDGATILREQFYQFGIGAQVQLLIERLNPSTYLYETLYLGDIDFTNVKDTGSLQGRVFTCNLVQGGITKAVKAYEDVKYTIPITGQKIVRPTPIKLQETCTFIFAPQSQFTEDTFPGLNIVTNEQKATVASVQEVPFTPAPPPTFAGDNKWFYSPTVSGRVRISDSNIKGAYGTILGGSVRYTLSIYNSDGAVIYPIIDGTVGDLHDYDLSFDGAFDVEAGKQYYLYGRFYNNGQQIITEGSFKISYDTISEATDVSCVPASYLYQQLMKKMNGDIPVPCQSFLLDAWPGLMITCGDAIRPVITSDVQAGDNLIPGQKYQVAFGSVMYALNTYTVGQIFIADANHGVFTTNDDGYVQTNNAEPAIVTSWADFFKAMNAILNVGWAAMTIGGVEYSVLEKKSYFYQPALKAIDVGEVGSWELDVYTAYIFNSVRYGYEDQQYDQLNGINEFNSTATATFPIKAIKKELDLVSPYRADSVGIELLRVNLSNAGSGSSNTSGNNDVFIIHCNPIPDAGRDYYSPYIMPVSYGASTNLYNMFISPKRNLLRHGDFMHGVLDKFDGENIVFASALKNYSLVTQDASGGVVSEKADISISSLPPKLFLPYTADIYIKEPLNMLDLLDKYANGYIVFEVDNTSYSGFIIDSSTDTDQNKPQKIKLLYVGNANMAGNIV